MNLTHVLSELRAERQQIEKVILVLERLAKWMASSEQTSKATSAGLRQKRTTAGQKRRTAAARKAAK
jgi:hypothetical protein